MPDKPDVASKASPDANKSDSVQSLPQADAAVAALLTQPTMAAVAENLGVSPVTLWRLMQKPDFQEQYRQARRQVVSHAIAQIQQATSQAVDTLRTVMADAKGSGATRVSAAKAVLELAMKAVELEDFDARLAAVEEAQEQLHPRKTSKRD